MTLDLVLEATDPLFFRDGSPFDAGDTPYLRGALLPTPSSGYGLARAVLVEALCSRAGEYAKSGCSRCPESGRCKAEHIVGDPSARDGALCTKGPYMHWRNLSWHTSPIDLTSESKNPVALSAGGVSDETTETDLGSVRFPNPGPDRQFQEDDQARVISEVSLSAYLSGQPVPKKDLIRLLGNGNDSSDAPLVYERRVGVARDRVSRATLKGHLYGIDLVRFTKDVKLIVRMEGTDQLKEEVDRSFLMPLGGEGKLVHVVTGEHPSRLTSGSKKSISESGRFKIVMLQHADFNGSWLPPGFGPMKNNGVTTWTGELTGMTVRLVSAKIGKAIQMGGWDTAARKPRELRSVVPAGSVYYFESPEGLGQRVVESLHDRCIGFNTQIGLGHVAVGVW